jgi:Protein of unknown function (DUF2934)
MAVRKKTKAQGTRSGNHIETSPDSRASMLAEPKHREGICSMEQIRMRAYELFMARGGCHGNDLGDWFMAERELTGSSRDSV